MTAVAAGLTVRDEVDPDDWSTFSEDPRSHEIRALCGHGDDNHRPLLEAHVGRDEFKAHGNCAFVWARKQHGRATEVRS